MTHCYIIKEIEFERENGLTIRGKAYIPCGDGRFPTLIFSHGFNGNYSIFENHGIGFAENGIASLFFDFCGGGEGCHSDGNFIDMTLETEICDLTYVLNNVGRLDFVDETRVFLLGESMGGFVSAYVAAMLPERVKSLLLWYPAFNICDDSKRRLAQGDNTCFGLTLNPKFNKIAAAIDIYDVIKKYDGNVRIIHGDKDGIVPISYSDEAVKVYKNATLKVIKDSDHGFNETDSETARQDSIDFILKRS